MEIFLTKLKTKILGIVTKKFNADITRVTMKTFKKSTLTQIRITIQHINAIKIERNNR